jgi:hypothetical protein
MYVLRPHGDQVRVGPHMTNNIVFAKLDILTLHDMYVGNCCDFWLCDCQLTTLYGKVAAKLSQLRALGPTLGGHTNQYIPRPKFLGTGWAAYDEQYRLRKARYPHTPWGDIDMEL